MESDNEVKFQPVAESGKRVRDLMTRKSRGSSSLSGPTNGPMQTREQNNT